MSIFLHLDGDAFFASCEVAVNPKLRGKPVVTGADKGIASSMSYEAKARGITRAMPLFQIKKLCPECIIVPSNFKLYKIISARAFAIVRRYTPYVEEYSIDECFADLSHLEPETIPQIARAIKDELYKELGVTFSVGVGPTKVLAKVGSKWKKPNGFTVIDRKNIFNFLGDVEISKVWGIGPSTAVALGKWGIKTAADFAHKPQEWVEEYFSKPVLALWCELNGVPVYTAENEGSKHKSMMRSRTFKATTDRRMVFAELSNNIEDVCTRLRALKLVTKHLSFYLKTQQFRYHETSVTLPHETASPEVMLEALGPRFNDIFRPATLYRSTAIILSGIKDEKGAQSDLFGNTKHDKTLESVHAVIDRLDRKYGTQSVFLASSMRAIGSLLFREKTLDRLYLPSMGEVG